MSKKYCEAMNSAALWKEVKLWHDGTNNNYAEETYDAFCKELEQGFTAWKRVRLIMRDRENIKVLKEQKNVAIP